jgi:hypothetical protein
VHKVLGYSQQRQNCTYDIEVRVLMSRQAIFEEFEEESSDEEDEDEDQDEDGLIEKTRGIDLDDDEENEESGTGVLTSQLRHFVIQVSPPFFISLT